MKTTVYACWEGLLYEATENLSQAVEKHKKILQAYLDNKVSENCLTSAKKGLELASQRMSDLVIAKKVIDEMEQKGVEL